jgi:hypothetical protein
MININTDKDSATSEQTPAPDLALVYVGLRLTKTTPFFSRQPGAKVEPKRLFSQQMYQT